MRWFSRSVSASLEKSSKLFCSQRRCLSFDPRDTEGFRVTQDLILDKDRRALARAITLIESTRVEDAFVSGTLLRSLKQRKTERLLFASKSNGNDSSGPQTLKPPPMQRRIAITGSPGAGKSCFIESLGMYLVEEKKLTVGVLAVDPSSVITKGSILGDKTRMSRLSMHPMAFVRPSPSRGHLGGVQARCWEVMELLEAASFDVVLVETVGVGQSEIEMKDMSDEFVLLVPPAAGDELQGVKKGIVEVADAVIVTKMDGPREKLALETRMAYLHAMCYTANNAGESKPVHCVSSEQNIGIDTAWEIIDEIWQKKCDSGLLDAMKKDQRVKHFHSYFDLEVVQRANANIQGLVEHLEDRVVSGRLSPREAAEEALAKVLAQR